MDSSEIEKIKKILTTAKTIAVVGISDKKEKPSCRVASYLKKQGYKIIPVNQRIKRVLGLKAYPDLLSVPDKIDVVDISVKRNMLPPM